ncbi:hypothetical protein DMN91_007638 [Ooceraea biroi]|uniref:Mos1 transposase HTH domain-containing protein n=1 Tax=Ooceraea biroi TaxID=2015173 RepID=A0A3L8DLG1_OOCBI|nr:histone-lysine N-methyltransferase SETMAR-like [Ooceraea biroi]RLU21022.1 hypothetical protein DMN91_007638 [Ooceraea biroi]
MLYYYRKSKTAKRTAEKIRAAYGENAVDEQLCQYWFEKFEAGIFDLRDNLPQVLPIDEVATSIKENRQVSIAEIALQINDGVLTVAECIAKLDLIKKLDIWVPQQLTEKNRIDRISICDSLLKRNEENPFLTRLVVGDEKWIIYKKLVVTRADELQTVSINYEQRKIRFWIWWDWEGALHYEFLPNNLLITSDVYCSHLDHLNRAIDVKRPEFANSSDIKFLHNDAKPYVSLQTRRKLLEFGWDVLPHPPHSPDLLPSDFHLFQASQKECNRIPQQ